MGHASTPHFRTFHSLRVKGFADVDTLSSMTTLPDTEVRVHLEDLDVNGWVRYREARSLWQLTSEGKEAHVEHLERDLPETVDLSALESAYSRFLTSNEEFKSLCGDWQLREGEPNDHSDAAYDGRVVERLVDLHEQAHPTVIEMGAVLDRLDPYGPRLAGVLDGIVGGESNMFTGVMCGSYHDVWMELHEDLILTQRIDRTAEGSF
jgi:hypothetical protein